MVETISVRASEAECAAPRWRAKVDGSLGRILKQDIRPLPGHDLSLKAKIRLLPGLGMVSVTSSGLVSRRSAEHVTGDDLLFAMHLSGGRVVQCAREATVHEGQ